MALKFNQNTTESSMNERQLNSEVHRLRNNMRIKRKASKIRDNVVALTGVAVLTGVLAIGIQSPPFVHASTGVEAGVVETVSAEIAEVEELRLDSVIPEEMETDLKVLTEQERMENAIEADVLVIDNASSEPVVTELVHVEEVVEEAPQDLMSKYSYALYDTSGNKNDIDNSVLQTLEQACAQYGVDTNLMLGIIMTESEGHANAKNKSSTATGFCQILRGTGKYIYEDIMGNGKGSYSHSMAYDPHLNVRMGAAYMGTLIRDRGSVYRAIQSYRGKSNISGYVKNINKYIGQVGLSVDSF